MKAWVLTYALKACIHLLLANYTQTPLDKVVVENSFVELMKDVRGDAGEDVGEWKVFPKWCVHWVQTFHIKLTRLFVPPLLPQHLQHVNHTMACTFLDFLIQPDTEGSGSPYCNPPNTAQESRQHRQPELRGLNARIHRRKPWPFPDDQPQPVDATAKTSHSEIGDILRQIDFSSGNTPA